jgi:opacity protein-like surface antigen
MRSEALAALQAGIRESPEIKMHNHLALMITLFEVSTSQNRPFSGSKHMRQVVGFAGLFLVLTFPAFSQVVPSASGSSGPPLAVGAGFSVYNTDWASHYMEGGSLWVDWSFTGGPSLLHGFGLEAEARDISLGRGTHSGVPANFRLDTAGGGVMYTWHHFHNLKPYAKFLLEYGGIDWDNPNPNFKHETRSVLAPGGGVEYRLFRSISLRGDYEYQSWPDIAIYRPNSTHILDPQGFTIGAMYDFRHRNSF